MAIILTRKVFSYWESVEFTRADTSFQILILTWKVVLSSATNTITCSPWSDELTLFFLKKCLPNTQVGKTLVFRVKMCSVKTVAGLAPSCAFSWENPSTSVYGGRTVCVQKTSCTKGRDLVKLQFFLAWKTLSDMPVFTARTWQGTTQWVWGPAQFGLTWGSSSSPHVVPH